MCGAFLTRARSVRPSCVCTVYIQDIAASTFEAGENATADNIASDFMSAAISASLEFDERNEVARLLALGDARVTPGSFELWGCDTRATPSPAALPALAFALAAPVSTQPSRLLWICS